MKPGFIAADGLLDELLTASAHAHLLPKREPRNVFNIQFYPAALDVLRSKIADSEFMSVPPEYRKRGN